DFSKVVIPDKMFSNYEINKNALSCLYPYINHIYLNSYKTLINDIIISP
ncbi:25637_t:CDS:1, partial [Gigaspora margarita]